MRTDLPEDRLEAVDDVGRLAGRAAREAVRAPTPAQKAAAIQRMFSLVAPRYDLLNHLLSLNIDKRWRRMAVDRLLENCAPSATVLDSCAGTLDLAVELAQRPVFRGRVVACDFALPMLQRGQSKIAGLRVDVACSNALRLPLRAGSAGGALIGFGLRNLATVADGLSEFRRVLAPGAPLVILEFRTPSRQPLRAAYLFYFRRLLPLLGRAISGHGSAYRYLPESVLDFPEPHDLADRMAAAGFRDVRWQDLSGGIAAVHWGIAADT